MDLLSGYITLYLYCIIFKAISLFFRATAMQIGVINCCNKEGEKSKVLFSFNET